MLSLLSPIEKKIKKQSRRCIIAAKIAGHAAFDKKKAKKTKCDLIIKFIEIMIANHPNCKICDEPMTACEGKRCLWQWSIDRIDDAKGHTMDNIRLTCYYCNIRQYSVMPSLEEARLMKRTISCIAG